MKKKLIAGMTSTALIASIGAPAFAANFSDVDGHWAAATIQKLADAGIISGQGDGTFAPNGTLTRAAFAKLVVMGLGLDHSSTTSSFSDVSGWAVGYVEAAKAAGIINGEDATHFNPEGAVTREAAAAMMVRALRTVGELQPGTALNFPDADEVSSWFKSDIEVAVANGLLNGKDGKLAPQGTATRAEAAVLTERLMGKADELKNQGFKVSSVTSVDAKTITVKFTKAVNTDTVIDSTNDTLVDGVFSLTRLPVASDSRDVVADDAAATLSEDGKTLTIVADGATYFSGDYAVTISDAVKDTNDNVLPKYSNVVKVNDQTRPTITKLSYQNYVTPRVYFSEPLADKGTVTFKRADGTALASASATALAAGAQLATDGTYLTVDLSSLDAADKDADIVVTIVAAKDFAGNLLSPNPVTQTVKLSTSDKTAPTISSVTATSNKSFDVKFSEALFANPSITVPSNVSPTITKDEDDATLYHVTFGTALSGLQNIQITAFEDLSKVAGASTTKVVNFSVDTTAPSFSGARVEKIDGVEYLVLSYGENVTPQTNKALSGTKVKDYVTTSASITTSTSGTINFSQYKPVNAKSSSVKLDLSALTDGAYTLDVPAGLVQDVNGNDSAATTVTFTRGSNTNVAKPVLVTTDAQTGNYVDGNGITVDTTNNNKFTIAFDKKLDPISALTKSNYSVEGATVESVALLANDSTNGYKVEVTLAKDSNSFSGIRTVNISGVKSDAGVAMDAVTTTEYLTENVRPTVTSAVLTGNSEVTLTFSEALDSATVVEGTAVVDFDIYIGSTKYAATVVEAAPSATKVKLSLNGTDTFSANDLAAGIKVKAATNFSVKDLNGNSANFSEVTVSQQ